MKRREPNFENMQKVLRRECPDRPVLFELFMNMPLYQRVNGRKLDGDDEVSVALFTAEAFARMGYDYSTVHASKFHFAANERRHDVETISLNEGGVISDEASFQAYRWNEPEDFETGLLESLEGKLPDGMKLMVMGPGGVLENVITLTGYDNLCFMIYEQPELVKQIFNHVGERLVRYYAAALEHPCVGMVSSNDDWGFNTQTFLTPTQMREYVFPWHKRIVELSHERSRPVLLHSCGNMRDVIDDIVEIGFDAKHSYEDNILPIEDAYEAWHDRIALLGGIDVDYICTKTPEQIAKRTSAMLERAAGRGGWAVGSGNSIPEYIPVEGFMAMIEAAIGYSPLQ